MPLMNRSVPSVWKGWQPLTSAEERLPTWMRALHLDPQLVIGQGTSVESDRYLAPP